MRTPHRFVSMAFRLLAGRATKTQTGAVVGGVAGTITQVTLESGLPILGHTDQLGSAVYNRAPSKRRVKVSIFASKEARAAAAKQGSR